MLFCWVCVIKWINVYNLLRNNKKIRNLPLLPTLPFITLFYFSHEHRPAHYIVWGSRFEQNAEWCCAASCSLHNLHCVKKRAFYTRRLLGLQWLEELPSQSVQNEFWSSSFDIEPNSSALSVIFVKVIHNSYWPCASFCPLPRMRPFCMAWEWSTSTIMPFSGKSELRLRLTPTR